jgi:hypothetical protein
MDPGFMFSFLDGDSPSTLGLLSGFSLPLVTRDFFNIESFVISYLDIPS